MGCLIWIGDGTGSLCYLIFDPDGDVLQNIFLIEELKIFYIFVGDHGWFLGIRW